jgi:uncharacterized membrane protein
MDWLHSLAGFLTFVLQILLGLGPILITIFVISWLFGHIKLLNQSVIDLQKRVKELEKGKK